MAKILTMNRSAKSKNNSVIAKAKNYKKQINEAYNAGYKSGWTDASKINNSSSGARVAAKTGYGKALDNQHRIKMYTEKAKNKI